MTLYNFTNSYGIMTYLEYPIILIQIFIMFYFVLKYKKLLHLPIVPISALTYTFTVIGFAMGVLPKNILSFMVVSMFFYIHIIMCLDPRTQWFSFFDDRLLSST